MKFKSITLITLMISICGCATSMTPGELNSKLPNLTRSFYLDKAAASEAVSQDLCMLLVANRSYTAPVGLTVDGDLQNGAKGIDEWVEVDGGNAYTLNNFNWLTIDQAGSTQLTVYFDTFRCERKTQMKHEI